MSDQERLARIRVQVDVAHAALQRAQRLAYEDDRAPLRVCLALNKAQDVLIKLLVHRLPFAR